MKGFFLVSVDCALRGHVSLLSNSYQRDVPRERALSWPLLPEIPLIDIRVDKRDLIKVNKPDLVSCFVINLRLTQTLG